MLNWYPTVNPLWNLEIWASQMRRNSLRIAPVSAILPINSTQTHPKNSSDTWSSTNTGAHSKWSQPALKSPQPETLPDRSLDTEVSASKSSVNAMLTQLEISSSLQEKQDCKTPRTDRTQSKWKINCYKMNGLELNNESSMPHSENTSGLSRMA